MRNFSKMIAASLIAATALGTALPAQARPYPYSQGMHNRAEAIRDQINDLQRRVQRNDRRDNVSGREAAGLRNAIARLHQQYNMMSRGGLTNREASVLQARIDSVRARLHIERSDRDNRRW
jgi:hypothetical protein